MVPWLKLFLRCMCTHFIPIHPTRSPLRSRYRFFCSFETVFFVLGFILVYVSSIVVRSAVSAPLPADTASDGRESVPPSARPAPWPPFSRPSSDTACSPVFQKQNRSLETDRFLSGRKHKCIWVRHRYDTTKFRTQCVCVLHLPKNHWRGSKKYHIFCAAPTTPNIAPHPSESLEVGRRGRRGRTSRCSRSSSSRSAPAAFTGRPPPVCVAFRMAVSITQKSHCTVFIYFLAFSFCPVWKKNYIRNVLPTVVW